MPRRPAIRSAPRCAALGLGCGQHGGVGGGPARHEARRRGVLAGIAWIMAGARRVPVVGRAAA